MTDRPVVLAVRTAVLALAAGLVLASAVVLFIVPPTAAIREELFARLVAGSLVAGLGWYFWRHRPFADWRRGRRWIGFVVALFFAGCVAALADPFTPIRGEYNVIRYWTSGALTLAAIVLVRGAFRPGFAWFERMIAVGFGAVLVLGAADELFQVHEDLKGIDMSRLPGLNGMVDRNDSSTFLLAVVGLVVAGGVAIAAWRFARAGGLAQRHKAAAILFLLACLSFMVAMTFDSLDWVLQSVLRHTLALVGVGPERVAAVDAFNPMYLVSNTLEELLEFLTACLFLATAYVAFPARAGR